MALTGSRRAAHPARATDGGALARRLALAAIVFFTVVLRARLLAVPLERDEGEYAYMGQLILRGEIPYVAAHSMKLPGVYYSYAAILAAFGQSVVAIRIGLLAVNLLSILLLYAVARRVLDSYAAVGAAAAYALLSLGSPVFGFTANAEHFVVLPMLAAVLLLVTGTDDRRLGRTAGAGVLLGVAFLMKQHAAAFVAFGGCYVVATGVARGAWSRRRTAIECVVFALGAAAPVAAAALGMYLAGAFDPFWFWTVTYAREYVTMIPVSIGVLKLEVQGLRIVGTAPAEWLLVAIGATAVWWDHATRRRAAFLLSFTAFSFLAVVTGWRFDEHYFVLLLPAASLLSGAGVSALTRALAARRADLAPAVGLALPLLAATLCLLQDRGYFFSLSPIEISRAIYGTNPFIEAVEIARYVREHSDRDDRIAVIGSEPEIYFYAQRRAATSYIYMYPLMEPQPFARAMQEKMIAEIEAAQPRFLVLVNVDQSWSRRSDSAQTVLEWTQQEANADYDTVGVAEIMPDGGTVYRWGAAARTFEPRSRSYVTLLERTAARPGADRLSAATRAERARRRSPWRTGRRFPTSNPEAVRAPARSRAAETFLPVSSRAFHPLADCIGGAPRRRPPLRLRRRRDSGNSPARRGA